MNWPRRGPVFESVQQSPKRFVVVVYSSVRMI
jgi:hypothetical protein